MSASAEHVVAGLVVAAICAPITVIILRRTANTTLQWSQTLVAVAATAVGGGAVGMWPPAAVAAGAAFVLLGVPVAAVDAVEHRIPNRLSLPLAGMTLAAFSGAAVLTGDVGGALGALAGCVGWGLLFLLSFLLTGQPGPGDVKLAPSAGLVLGWFGWSWVIGGLAAAYLLTAVIGLIGVAVGRLRDGQVPMGPSIVAVTVAAGTLAQL